jgi:hypothetical protein
MSIGTMTPPLTAAADVDEALARRGFAVVDGGQLEVLLGVLPGVGERAFAHWSTSWNQLPPDNYLRDGGRYRQRRHGSFVVDGDSVAAAPHRAHWQPVEYNALHGGLERWFQPLDSGLVAEPLWSRLLLVLAQRASALRAAQAAPRVRPATAIAGDAPASVRQGGRTQPWYVEAHQFRIDTAGGIGRPTPEGAHRDGVDMVAVMLVSRVGIKGGETRVFDAAGPSGLRFTMDRPWQLLLLDDARVIHETTPIQPVEANRVGHRDTLVVTLRAGGFLGPS